MTRAGETPVLKAIQVEVAGSVLVQNLIVGSPWEDGSAEQEYVKNEPHREDITDGIALSLQVPNIDYLRSHIPRSPTSNKQVVLLLRPSSQPKIHNHHFARVGVPQHNILRLQVSMHDPLGMHVL